MVDNSTLDDDGTVYTCTSEGAPEDFVSITILNVTRSTYMCVVCTFCMCTYVQYLFVLCKEIRVL